MKLCLGAGNAPMADAVNHDIVKHRPEINVAHDLNILPWPWPDNSFDLVVAYSVLEHLRMTLIESMGEIWRILKPDGMVCVKAPYWNHARSWQDPTHYWRFDPTTFDIFDEKTQYGAYYTYYMERKWQIIRPAELSPGKSSIFCDLKALKPQSNGRG